MKISLRENVGSNPRCGYCHDELKDAQRTACTACRAPHHLDCWVENSGCTACFHTRCDRPEEIRQLAQTLRKQRRKARRTPRPRTAVPSQGWISLIFIAEVFLAFFVVVLGLIEGHAWVIVAYLTQGIALAIYFAFADQPAEPRPRERRGNEAPRIPRRHNGQRNTISDRIRIRGLTNPNMMTEFEVVGLPVIDDLAQATLIGQPFAEIPPLNGPPPPAPNPFDPIPPGLTPTLPNLPNSGLPDQIFHPFHDNLNNTQDLIQNVNNRSDDHNHRSDDDDSDDDDLDDDEIHEQHISEAPQRNSQGTNDQSLTPPQRDPQQT